MGDIIKQLSEAVIDIGFERTLILMITGSVLLHYWRSFKIKPKRPHTPVPSTSNACAGCIFDLSALELTIRRTHVDLRREILDAIREQGHGHGEH